MQNQGGQPDFQALGENFPGPDGAVDANTEFTFYVKGEDGKWKVRTGLNSIDLFNPHVPTIPVLDHDETILEVKYNRVLPPYLVSLLSFACPEATQTAVSKYTLCRQYEEKE